MKLDMVEVLMWWRRLEIEAKAYVYTSAVIIIGYAVAVWIFK